MRLFFGLSLPGDIRQACAALAERCEAAIPGRYAIAENYHITLAFIGNVDESRMGDAADVLQETIRDVPAPRVTLANLSYFNRAQNAILVLRADAQPDLAAVHDALVRGLLSRGLPADAGPFAPHITLARHASIAPGALEAAGGVRGEFTCPQAHLFLSARDEHDVLRYTPLSCANFAKAGV